MGFFPCIGYYSPIHGTDERRGNEDKTPCPTCPRALLPGREIFFPTTFFFHGSKCQFIDGINLNLTHVCVYCEIIFVFTYIALVVFIYKVNKKKIIQ